MKKIKQVLSEALGETVVESTCPECHKDPCVCEEVKEDADIARLRQLSGLKVDEGLGYGEEQMLNKMLQEIEISVNRAEALLNRYAKKVGEMSSYMDEEDQMHYGYGVQAMVDLISDMHARVQKLG